MIWVFGSSHIDPDEGKDLTAMLSVMGKRDIIVAMEVESDSKTTKAIKEFKDMDAKTLNGVLEREYGKRRVIAPQNFIKLMQRTKNTSGLVSIEAPQSRENTRINKRLGKVYAKLESLFKQLKSNPERPGIQERLLRSYYSCIKEQRLQSKHRERTMIKVIVGLAKRNPESWIVLYCGYPHSAYLKTELKKLRMKFKQRDNRLVNRLEKEWVVFNEVIQKTDYSKLSKGTLLDLARDLVLYTVVWLKPRDTSIATYSRIEKAIYKKVKSISDYNRLILDPDGVRKSVYKELGI